MATHTDEDFLTLAQWLSPAYPLGSFAYSHGLEAAAELGQVTDAKTLGGWLSDLLRHGGGWSDAVFLAAAHGSETAAALAIIDETCEAYAPSMERRRETEWQGTAFAGVTASVWQMDLPLRCFPVAVGRAARLAGLPVVLTSQMYLQGFAANLVAAAQRLLPIGQTDAQRLIHALAPVCRAVAGDTAQGALDQLTSTTFLSDICAMRHETQNTRIFRT